MEEPTPIVDAPSKPPPRFRRTRIAVSVFFGVLTLLLCVLWVWSYWSRLGFSGNRGDEYIVVAIIKGELYLSRGPKNNDGYKPWRVFPEPLVTGNAEALENNRKTYGSHLGVGWHKFGLFGFNNGWQVSVSLWLPTLVSVALAAIPWLRWRFSLRTMLIVTTLVAVVLGLVVWAGK